MSSEENRGKRLERFLSTALGRFLLPDYVIANPMVRFGSGKVEELADAIIPFLDNLITMQFKSKKQDKEPATLESKDYARIRKKISEASDQAKTTVRAYKQGLLKRFVNLRGVEMPIEPGIKEMESVIVIELEGEEKYDYYARTRCVLQYIEEHGLSHHIFFLDDFQIILQWHDTIKDFWLYLKFRKKFLSARRIHYPFCETDLLSCSIFSYGRIMKAFEADDRVIVLEMGMYRKEMEVGKELLRKRNLEYLKCAWVIDAIIDWIHTILHPDAEKDNREKRNQSRGETDGWGDDVYYHLIKRYGSLSRLERYAFGEKILEKAEKADHSERGYNFVLFQTDSIPGHGFLLAATREKDLSRRFDIIDALCFAAIHQSELTEVTGVITDSASATTRSFQFSCTKFDNKDPVEMKWHEKHKIFKDGKHETMELWEQMRKTEG